MNNIDGRENPAFTYVNKFSDYIGDLCSPLQKYFGISNFSYHKIFLDSRYFYVSNNYKLVREYIDIAHKDPIIFFEREIHSLKTNKELRYIIWPSKSSHYLMDLHLKHQYWHGLSVIKINEDSIDGWSFTTHPNNTRIYEFYDTHHEVLEKFIYYFQDKTRNMFNFEKKGILSKFEGTFDISCLQNNTQAEKINEFLKTIKQASIEIKSPKGQIRLSAREIECLHLLSLGKTAKETAASLSISNRTAEFYIANIKEKTGYRFKSNLIELYHDQLIKYSF